AQHQAIAVQFFLSKKSACFQTIMGSGSSVNSQAKSDTVDESAALQRLAKLVIQGDFGQVRQLAMRRLVKSKDGSGRTVLMLVADTRGTPLQAEKCILYLFELGADPKASDAEGNTAAHLAARRDHVRVLALLPFEAKWLQNERGRTPLMEAVLFGSWKCAKHLLHLLRQERFIDEYRGVSTARQLGRFLKASYTGDMSRNPMRQKFFGMKDQNGQTALELAKFKGYSELASYIEREMRLDVVAIGLINGLTKQEEADREKLECLAREGNVATLLRLVTRANCDLPSRAGHTMLMHLVRSVEIENASVWKQLLNLADPTCADINANTCVHHAAEAGNDSAIVALLNAGAAANATKDNGETPLIAAASNTPIRRAFLTGWFLLAGGADWSLKDSRGCTAYEIALEYDKEDLTDLLQPYQSKKFFDETPNLSWKTRRGAQTDDIWDEDESWSPERAEFPEVQPSTGSQSGATTRQTNWSEEEFYPVTNPQGFCIIINIGKYEELKHKEGGTAIIDPEIREGSAKDVQLVRQVFEELCFIVKVREDLKTQEIDDYLNDVKRSEELNKHGSFVCFLMAHGSHDCIYGADWVPYPIDRIVDKFQSYFCQALSRKPKIFFIQACRTNTLAAARSTIRSDRVPAMGQGQTRSTQEAGESSVTFDAAALAPLRNRDLCPAEGDFLRCFASTPGSVAIRDTHRGSPFVQILCRFLQQHYKVHDVSHIMTKVNNFLQKNSVETGDGKLQSIVTQKVDQLARRVSFDPSRAN
ncbi:hypothetical protein BOX15_Mlig009377g1, partial [Macrostomum lignano]